MKNYILPFFDKLEAVYQVTGNNTMTYNDNKLREYDRNKFQLFLLWKSKIYLFTSRIMVPLHVRLILYLKHPHGIHVHDGPGMNSEQVYHKRSVIHLSSFQAFVVVFTDTWNSRYDIYSWELELSYKSREIKAIKVHINNSQTLDLPPCTNFRHNYMELHKMSNTGGHLFKGNLHCIYNITSNIGYVNMSISQLTYIGIYYDYLHFADEFIANCYHGGVAFKLQQLCNNYTSEPRRYTDKLLMGIVSGSRDGLMVVVYSFKYYSEVTVEATVTSTPCKGTSFTEGNINLVLDSLCLDNLVFHK